MKYEEPKIVIPELERLIGTAHFRAPLWKSRDDAVLIMYYGRVRIGAISKYLGRTVAATKFRIQTLKEQGAFPSREQLRKMPEEIKINAAIDRLKNGKLSK